MRARSILVPVFVALVLACGGLAAEVQGPLQVDGAAFVAESCTSGEVHGFSGFELKDAAGTAVRVAIAPDNTAEVFVFDPGASTGVSLGPCGSASVRKTALTVNNVVALEGSATLQCAAAGRSVDGQVSIARCATKLW